jgi:hypothetical protein
MNTMKEYNRKMVFTPYNNGPVFTLHTYRVWLSPYGPTDGKERLEYTLHMKEHGISSLVFHSDDFRCSPLHATDSDETMRSLMGFLTLRPGDVEDEYFTGYSTDQRDFADLHAEALWIETETRLGGD